MMIYEIDTREGYIILRSDKRFKVGDEVRTTAEIYKSMRREDGYAYARISRIDTSRFSVIQQYRATILQPEASEVLMWESA